MRAHYCRPGDDVKISLRDTHFLVEDGVEEVLLRPPTIAKLSNLPVKKKSDNSHLIFLIHILYIYNIILTSLIIVTLLGSVPGH